MPTVKEVHAGASFTESVDGKISGVRVFDVSSVDGSTVTQLKVARDAAAAAIGELGKEHPIDKEMVLSRFNVVPNGGNTFRVFAHYDNPGASNRLIVSASLAQRLTGRSVADNFGNRGDYKVSYKAEDSDEFINTKHEVVATEPRMTMTLRRSRVGANRQETIEKQAEVDNAINSSNFVFSGGDRYKWLCTGWTMEASPLVKGEASSIIEVISFEYSDEGHNEVVAHKNSDGVIPDDVDLAELDDLQPGKSINGASRVSNHRQVSFQSVIPNLKKDLAKFGIRAL